MGETIALLGAGGKMGCRITDNLKDSEYWVLYVEVSEAGIERLRQRGLSTTPQAEALGEADVVILALPDKLIGDLAPAIVTELKSGAIVVCLDPAAPFIQNPADGPDGDEPQSRRSHEKSGDLRQQHVPAEALHASPRPIPVPLLP